MRFALLSAAAVAGLALTSGSASAQHRGNTRTHTVTRTHTAGPVVSRNFRAPSYNPVTSSSSFQVTPYNAGLLNLSSTYGPNYRGMVVPQSGGMVGFTAGGLMFNGVPNTGSFNSTVVPNYGAFPAWRR
jgi:hypothetical protein